MSSDSRPSAGNKLPETSNLTNVQEFIYQPLPPQQIRLLRITKDSEELHIIHTGFESAPAYTALSYIWNGESRNQPILIDGYSLKVINNFYIALPHLVKAAKTQYLWVDGLCINQEDDNEKAIQVPLMQQIYASCRESLVWLGESTSETEIAIDSMPRIRANLGLYDASEVWDVEGIGVRSPGTPDSALWKGLANIFSRPWFKRVWTFQEAILPTIITFLFSTRVVAFDDMASLASPLLVHLTSLEHFYADTDLFQNQSTFVGFLKTIRIKRIRSSGQKFQNHQGTLRILYFTRSWSSTNPLDKVYGLLGLTDPSLPNSLLIDYSKSVIEVSIEIAQWYLEYGEDLFILNLASSFRWLSGGRLPNLPSLIPHFGRFASHWCMGVIWRRGSNSIQRNRKKSASMIGRELHVDGIRIDKVSQIILCKGEKHKTQAEQCQKILDWEEECLAASRLLFQGEPGGSIPEAHWTTMISAICDYHITPSKREYELFKSFLGAVAMEKPLSPELEARSQVFSIQVRRFLRVATMGHFFSTTNGRIGIGSKRIQPGDQITVFFSGFTPFVIRPLPGSDPKYKLIGDSYIFGFMSGEAFREETASCHETFVLV